MKAALIYVKPQWREEGARGPDLVLMMIVVLDLCILAGMPYASDPSLIISFLMGYTFKRHVNWAL